jgi:hypothetical protein
MPTLTLRIDKLDDVPETARSFYKRAEGDGAEGFVLDLDAADDPSALKGSVRKLEDTVKKLRPHERTIERIKKLFPDASDETIADVVADAVKAATKGKGKKGESDDDDKESLDQKVEKRVRERLEELNPELEKGRAAQSELRKERIENRARRALEKAGVIADRMDDALELFTKTLDLDEDGKKVIVLDEDGDPRTISLDEYASREFKKAKPYFYAGSQSAGSESPHSTRRAPTDRSQMSSIDKISAGFAQRAGR